MIVSGLIADWEPDLVLVVANQLEEMPIAESLN